MNVETNKLLSEAERIAWGKVYKIEKQYTDLQKENIELRQELEEQLKLNEQLRKSIK
jgi:hypothetical protein